MYRHEKASRRLILTNQLELFNSVLMSHIHTTEELSAYLHYMEDYFKNTPLKEVLIAVYDANTGRYIDGNSYKFNERNLICMNTDGVITGDEMERMTVDSIGFRKEDAFYYSTSMSRDSSLVALTVMPYNVSVAHALTVNTYLWITIFLTLIVITAIAYISTSHITRNIRILRDFATRAANDRELMTYTDFPKDELGDISREIIHIYNSRSAANAAREHEHSMALHAIEERTKLKRDLTNNISHELKTPVGIIKGYLDTIIDSPEMDDNSRSHFLTKAQAQVNRLCDLLNDLSHMTRLEESPGTIATEAVNFHDLVASTIDEVEASGIAGNMKLSYVIPFDCEVVGNRGLLSAMLLNLIKNAAFYSRGNEIVIKCTGSKKNYYTFLFYDDGVGVPPESLPHLFERFYRVDTGRSRRNGGTGLGLPIVKSTINAFGGNITVANRDNGGLQFTFTLKKADPQQ